MEYKLTTQSLLSSLSWVLLFSFVTVIVILLGDLRFSIGIVVLSLVFAIPQLLLIIPYNRVSNYQSFRIDYSNELFIIKFEDKTVEKSFAELASVQHHATKIPFIYLSAVFKLCEHLYYYRFEFQDGTIYYLTSLVDPQPRIDPKGAFYTWFLEMNRTYATIK